MTFAHHLPALDPIVAHEVTATGWRGLIATGEVLEVTSRNGDKAEMPDGEIIVVRGGKPVGRRAIHENAPRVTDYVSHYDRAIELFHANDPAAALKEYDAAIAVTPTARARFNRALALLALGRWREGFADYEARYDFSPDPNAPAVPRWRGESIRGKTLLLYHDAGFGDAIQNLRYVPMLQAMGARVKLQVPPVLARLAAQFAPLANAGEAADYFCGYLSLLHWLDQRLDNVPHGKYLEVDPVLRARWRERLRSPRKKIGIAWSVGRIVDGDYLREIPLDMLVGALVGALGTDVELHSVQQQDRDAAAKLGVITHEFEDFADCAALVSLMDKIVTVDTAAVHVAGAIGHPDVTVLLGYLASWRWLNNPFYPQIRIAQQKTPGDWASALALL